MDINIFVRGMAWHDVGKPFYLGGQRHSRLGYLWLDALGHPDEALATLAHYGKRLDAHLRRYWKVTESLTEAPAVLAVANALDRAAAVTYSFMGEPPPEPGGETHHSWQNSFSRLPQKSPKESPQQSVVWSEPFDVSIHEMDRGDVRARFLHYLEKWPEPDAKEMLSAETIDILSGALEEADDDEGWRQVDPVPSQEQRKLALDALLDCTAQYPERTYPPMNDTTLKEHALLSGVLAFVLYCNLEARDLGFLTQKIILRGGQVRLDGRPLDKHIGQLKAMKHLDGFLVRISLEGHRDMFANAVRLDDLHGARTLAKRTCDALIAALAEQLDVPELANFLVITRTPFDVTYYLPASMGREGVRQAITAAYDAALDQVTGELIGDLEWDFRGAKERLDWPSQRNDLKRQLHALAYGLSVLPVAVEERADFDTFTAAFAHQLVTAYEDSLQVSPFPQGELRRVRADLELPGGDGGSVHDICLVCETHPIYRTFVQRAESDDYLRKAVHTFRGEPEPICVSCIARRILAHGAVESKPLNAMLKLEGQTVTAQQVPGGPSLPPNLIRTAKVSPGDHVDMGAAFVRQTRSATKRAKGQLLDVFPTVHYAADETGNVALLTLEPTRHLFGTYEYAEIVELLEKPDLKKLGVAYEAAQLRGAFEATFVNYYRQVKGEKPGLVKQVCTVPPHLARVLARIAQVECFYTALQEGLQEYPLRVLPIDTAYPTARLMVPADQIDVALKILDQVVAEDLFSASVGQAERAFLSRLVPPLLRGSVVVMKEKYPLYLALEAERVLMRRLEEAPANQYWGEPLSEDEEEPKPQDSWFGLRLGLCDLRGTLAERGPWQGQVLWDDLGEVGRLEGTFDRVTVLRKAILEQGPGMKPLADALALIRANVAGIKLADAGRLEDPALFRPVLFLKRLTREGRR